MRYKEELEQIAKREAYIRRKYIMPAFAVFVLLTVLAVGTLIKPAMANAAPADMAVVKLSDVTKKDIEDAKRSVMRPRRRLSPQQQRSMR